MASTSDARQETEQIRDLLQTKALRVNSVVMAVVVGLIMGIGLFAVTNLLRLRDGPKAGPHLALLGQLFFGYRVTFIGSVIGFVWAFATGFIATYVGATIYNKLAQLRDRQRRRVTQ